MQPLVPSLQRGGATRISLDGTPGTSQAVPPVRAIVLIMKVTIDRALLHQLDMKGGGGDSHLNQSIFSSLPFAHMIVFYCICTTVSFSESVIAKV